jgi:hypothetical protein
MSQPPSQIELAQDYVKTFDELGIPAIACSREGIALAFNSLFKALTGFDDHIIRRGPAFSASMLIEDNSAADYLLADIAGINTSGAFLGGAIITIETTFGSNVQAKLTLTPFGVEPATIVLILFRRATFFQGIQRGGSNFRQFIHKRAQYLGYILGLLMLIQSLLPLTGLQVPEPPAMEDIAPSKELTSPEP